MKKNLMFAMFGAIALTGAVGLSSCSDEEMADVNLGYNPETGDVNVELALNISTNTQSTRMSSNSVQYSGNFRGIQKALLLTYSLETGTAYHVVDPNTECNRQYDLDRLIEAGELDVNGSPKSRRVLEMSLPSGTNSLMFWGKAIKGSSNETFDSDADQGKITFAPNKNLSQASFKLTACLDESDQPKLLTYEDLISEVVNKIVQSSVTINETLNGTTFTNKLIKWSDYAVIKDGKLEKKLWDPSTSVIVNDDPEDDGSTLVPMSALGEILSQLFVTFNTFHVDQASGTSELRNGEGHMISLLMMDLYNVLLTVTQADATTAEEKAAQRAAKKIQDNIDEFFTVTKAAVEGEAGKYTVTGCVWKAISSIDDKLTTNCSSITNTGEIDKFPSQIFHLPPGACILTYNINTNTYAYMTQVPTYAMGAGDSFNPFNYMYPAELCYYGNSPIRVSAETHKISDYPDGVANWDNETSWGSEWTKNGSVLSTTRSIAMQEDINYGTSLLVTSVKIKPKEQSVVNPASGESDTEYILYDNNQGLHPSEAPKEIPVANNSFQLTGVLIGGQAQEVGWNYLPKIVSGDTDGSKTFKTMVYDNQVEDKVLRINDYCEPTYTMVWDNYNEKATAQQNVVYVALQFYNNSGYDFWGMNDVIRSNSTFYIVGALNPAGENVGSITWPSEISSAGHYALPPYNSNGSTNKVTRVFIQDYKTIAKFILDENSLKSALVSVPDLRSSQLSLGLSVDLEWRSGLTFDGVVLGDDSNNGGGN